MIHLRLSQLFLLSTLLTACNLLGASPAQAAETVSAYAEQGLISSDTAPILLDGHAMVPLSMIAETLAAGIQWQDPKIIISKNDRQIIMTVDSTAVTINDRPDSSLDLAPYQAKIKSWYRCVLSVSSWISLLIILTIKFSSVPIP